MKKYSYHPPKTELKKGAHEIMGELAEKEEEYHLAAYHYLQAAKQAPNKADAERLYSLSRKALETAYLLGNMD